MATTAAGLVRAQRLPVQPDTKELREMTTLVADRLPSLCRIAFRWIGNMADAEDAVQDALLSAYTHLDQFRGTARMSTWLTSIVINSVRMKVRGRGHRVHVSLDVRDGEESSLQLSEMLADPGPDPEVACRRQQLMERLAEWSSALPPSHLEIFRLRDFEGRTVRETAAIVGLSEGTVKNRLARVRSHLRKVARARPEPQSRHIQARKTSL